MSAHRLVTFSFVANDTDGLEELIEAAAQELDAFADPQLGEFISIYDETSHDPS